MPRPTKVDRLPPEIKDTIADLRRAGHSLDQILAHLRQLGVGADNVSRTGLYHHIAKLDELGEMMRQDRIMADALVARFGEEPDDKTFRANIQMMQSLLLKLNIAARTEKDGAFSAQEMMFLSMAMKNLATASKSDTDRIEKLEKRAAEKAAAEERERAKRVVETAIGGAAGQKDAALVALDAIRKAYGVA
jgi:AcrR family transcriptional regulator